MARRCGPSTSALTTPPLRRQRQQVVRISGIPRQNFRNPQGLLPVPKPSSSNRTRSTERTFRVCVSASEKFDRLLRVDSSNSPDRSEWLLPANGQLSRLPSTIADGEAISHCLHDQIEVKTAPLPARIWTIRPYRAASLWRRRTSLSSEWEKFGCSRYRIAHNRSCHERDGEKFTKLGRPHVRPPAISPRQPTMQQSCPRVVGG